MSIFIYLTGCSEKPETLPGWALSSDTPVEAFTPVSPESGIKINYPLDEAMFPPEIIAPTFLWEDTTPTVDRWVLSFRG
ncbi:MAG TPA: hypothetical protein PLV91_06970, partial [Verrucomicrobiota bacterium]|nr:hypothetical protein [Verrucomicrobiota bacterium]